MTRGTTELLLSCLGLMLSEIETLALSTPVSCCQDRDDTEERIEGIRGRLKELEKSLGL